VQPETASVGDFEDFFPTLRQDRRRPSGIRTSRIATRSCTSLALLPNRGQLPLDHGTRRMQHDTSAWAEFLMRLASAGKVLKKLA
jgi:hypothetical protein